MLCLVGDITRVRRFPKKEILQILYDENLAYFRRCSVRICALVAPSIVIVKFGRSKQNRESCRASKVLRVTVYRSPIVSYNLRYAEINISWETRISGISFVRAVCSFAIVNDTKLLHVSRQLEQIQWNTLVVFVELSSWYTKQTSSTGDTQLIQPLVYEWHFLSLKSWRVLVQIRSSLAVKQHADNYFRRQTIRAQN